MTMLHLSPAISAVETIATYGAKTYTLASEVFTVGFIFWTINFMSNMIEKTYKAGIICGKFYRAKLHSHVKNAMIATIAFVIILSQLFYEGCKLVYTNRNEILENVNNFRNQVGSYFTYTSVESV
jgi:hypothetical protein